ncbi:MAG: prephenate dehydratase [Deltaproteobacteria bacterium]|nr:prephenate dehydratase [Deltaproteobacteria bacterium]
MKGSKRTGIEKLRKKIDGIDAELLDLLNKRASIAIEVGRVKKREKSDFYSPEREREIIKRLTAMNRGPFPSSALRNVYREIMSASLSLENPLKVAFLGPSATFTHQAALQHFGLSSEFLPKKDIPDVFDDVERGKAAFGVVPVENTAEGAVSHTLDMFVSSNLKICAEVMVQVSLTLLNKSGRAGDIMKVCSHPHALAESGRWLKEHLPNVSVVDVGSTAMAAQMATSDPAMAAIASEAASSLYDLRVVERKIEDHPNNFTRFLVIGKKESAKTGNDKTSVMFAIKDQPGALYRILKPFAARDINLTKIESRPLKTKAWEYVYIIDLDGHISDRKIKEAVGELGQSCSFMKILGSYQKYQ